MKKIITLALAALLCACQSTEPSHAEKDMDATSNPTEELTADKMDWWREARFGMFIHWGLYAIPAGEYNGKVCNRDIGEWIMDDLEIPIKEYEQFAGQFNPVNYDPEEWVRIAKDAGMKYIVITSKHHDGFCLWDSEITDYDVVDASPYGKDLLKPLAEACEKAGIKLCFYHSIMDWHHPDAQAMWEPNYQRERSFTADSQKNPHFPQYVQEYLKPQLEELLTNYGDIGVLWFDGEWVPAYTSEHGRDIYDFITDIKPDLIVNNRVDKGRQGMKGINKEGSFVGDFGTPEQEIPETGLPGVDWEACMTMNDTWGFRKDDHNWKSDTVLLHQLIDIVTKGGNLLLNIGPQADGRIPEASIERLASIGKWTKVNGEAIYGTSASPVEAPGWGKVAEKDGNWYVFVLDASVDKVTLPLEGKATFTKAQSLSGKNVEMREEAGSLTLSLSEDLRGEMFPVIKLQ